MEKCIIESEPTQEDEAVNGSVLSCKAVNGFYVCIYGGYYFEWKDLAEVLGYLIQINYICHREYPSQVRSLLKFIAHLYGAKVSLSTAQKSLLR